ncbi:MAG: alpha/beta hydrolase [Methanomicrobiaceae archaeon]|nr:alpha/beta hydrolase [Methanomicrobiaceae archaeon]
MTDAAGFVNLLRGHSPGKNLPIETVRKDFSEFYLSYQDDQKPVTSTEIIRDDLQGTWINVPGCRHKSVILFFHGGGFTIGSTEDHIGLCSRLASAAGIPVFGIDYRLAPEYTFPAPVEDAMDSYRFLLAKGYDSSDIVPVGISAGGTLVLSMLIELRERHTRLPDCAVCMSPAVNLLFEGGSVTGNIKTDWITPRRLDSIRNLYLKGEDPRNPVASPYFADLTGLPPLLIQAGGGELLRDDIISFVEKAEECGVDVDFELWEGMFHCWQVFASVISEGDEAINNIGNYIRKNTG